jgi:hypothetical protein
MKAGKSNCFFGAVAIKRRLGGRLKWRSGWHKGGWQGFLDSPWGHFRVILPDGTTLSYNTEDRNLAWWRQLWFQGRVKRRRIKNEE